MALLSPEDLAGMVSDAGTEIAISGAGTIMGIVSDNYEALELGPHSAEGAKTVAMLTQADVEKHRIRKDTTITIERTIYRVRRIETLRPGFARVFLALA